MSYPTGGSLSQILTNSNTAGAENTNTSQFNSGNSLAQTNQQPIFTSQQLGLQGQAGNLMNQLLTGNTSQFGLPQAVWDAANMNFNNQEAPQLAAQYGSGSPAIGAAQQQLTLQLAGLAGQNQTSNALNTFNAAANYAFNPIGMNQSSLSQGNTSQLNQGTTNTLSNQTNTDIGGLLGGIGGSFLT
ncbi:MAG TPA: hypothetical protein V6C76_12685 [Drouetiella sp.]